MLANFCQPETGSLCSVIIVNNFKERKRRLACLCIKIYRDIYSRQSCCAARPFTPHPSEPTPRCPPPVSAAVGVAPVSEAPPTGSSDIKVLPSIFRKGPSYSTPRSLPLAPPPPPGCLPRATPPHSDTILSIRLAPAEINPPPPAGLLQQQCAIFRHYPPSPSPHGGVSKDGPTNQIPPPLPTFPPPLPLLLNAQLWRENATCVPFSFSCVCMCVRSVKNCKSDLSPPTPTRTLPPSPALVLLLAVLFSSCDVPVFPALPLPKLRPQPLPLRPAPPLIFKMTTLCRCCLL